MSKVTVIPATRNIFAATPINSMTKRRVAGYARVSTDSDEQFTSFEAQTDYYTKFIKNNPAWEFVGVYTDEGISGTNTKHREGFNAMIADALSGKIDLIVTKSVSRFARNTVDSLVTIRELKAHNVEVYFEKEAIYTFDGKGELLLTIMSSLAQEESRSISENVTWGQRKRFSDGKVSMPYKAFLGYEKGEGKDAPPVINEEQATIVRRIYAEFMKGKTPFAIAKMLTEEEILTPRGGKKWEASVIKSILTNEKYKGAALLQKSFTVDFLTHKKKKNEGEIPQYYVEHSHEPIIPPEEWEAVQQELERRKRIGKNYSGANSLASNLVCGDCGGFYGVKVWHSTDKYRKEILRCNKKYEAEKRCTTPILDAKDIMDRFVKAYNQLYKDKASVLDAIALIKAVITNTAALDREIEEIYAELQVVVKLTEDCISENRRIAQNQDDFSLRYNALVERYDSAKSKYDSLIAKKERKLAQSREIDRFTEQLKNQPNLLTEFDDSLWITTIEKAVVRNDGIIEFHFYGGQIIEA